MMRSTAPFAARGIAVGALIVFGLSAEAKAADGWGASWSFGPVHPTATNHIVYTKTTLVPGRLPPINSTTGPLFLWPGLSNPTSDLIQTTMDAWPDNASYCHATAGQWCVEASVFGSFGQRNGPTVAIDPDDHVTIEYQLGADNNTWTQTVTSQKLGKVVSTLQSTSGLMPGGGFGFATEADADSYTIDTQYYLCTEIHLAAADPSFGATGVGAAGAQYGATGTGSGRGSIKNLRTPDGGLTWLADLITLPAMNPQGPQTTVPAYDCGTGGAGGAGGTGPNGGTAGSGGAAAGSSGAAGSAGRGGAGGTGGRASGGSPGAGGTATGGNAGGAGGTTGPASGGETGTGGIATGGHVGGTGGAVTENGGAGGAMTGSGGSGAGAGTGGGSPGSGGSSRTSSGAGDQSSGCTCSTQRGSPRNGGLWFLPVALLFALAGGRRRR